MHRIVNLVCVCLLVTVSNIQWAFSYSYDKKNLSSENISLVDTTNVDSVQAQETFHNPIEVDSVKELAVKQLILRGDSCLLRYNTIVALRAYEAAEKLCQQPYVLRKLAQCQYERGVFATCLESLNKIPKDSITHQDLRMQYHCFNNMGERDSAMVFCQHILDKYPYDAQMTVNMATYYNQREQPDSALMFTEKFRETDKNNAIVNQQQAFLLYQKGEYKSALDEYRRLREMKVDNSSICYYMGLCYNMCDSLYLAEENLLQAARKENFSNPHVLSYLGVLSVQIGKYGKGLEYIKKSLALIKPNEKQMFMLSESMSNACFYMEKYQESIVHLKECLKYNPDHIYTYYKLGQAYGRLKQIKREKDAYCIFVEKAEQKQSVRQSLRNLIDDAKIRIRQINEESFFKGGK